MKKRLLIIKFGGSVITDKNQIKPMLKLSVIRNLAKEIGNLYHSKKSQIILVHGAGSFGHPLAKKYNLQKGMKTEEQRYGFCLTDQKMIELNSFIMQELLNFKIPVVSLPPRSFVKQAKGKFLGFNHQIVKSMLKQNIMPVLFGDAVLDDSYGCSILSGDTIITYLASDPKKNPHAKLIPEVTNKNLKQVLQGLTINNRNDVTGEMKGKIMAIKKTLPHIPASIISGLKPQNLVKAVEQHQIGTKLLFH